MSPKTDKKGLVPIIGISLTAASILTGITLYVRSIEAKTEVNCTRINAMEKSIDYIVSKVDEIHKLMVSKK